MSQMRLCESSYDSLTSLTIVSGAEEMPVPKYVKLELFCTL